MVLGGCALVADAATMVLTPNSPVVAFFRGWPCACTFACGPPAGVALGVAGGDFFKAAFTERGQPDPAPPVGSRTAGGLLQLILNLVVNHGGGRPSP